MNSSWIQPVVLAAGVICCGTAVAIDRGLYDRYQGYKQYQERGQQELLKQARDAAKDWDFELAEEHLAAARNMAYAPDEIRAVEKLIADNRAAKADKERREREEAERQRRAAAEATEAEEQRKREQEEQRRLAARRSYSGSSGGSSGGGSVDFVMVDADCTGWNCPPDAMRISLSGGPGYISDNNTWNPTITEGFGGGMAGTYNYQVTFGRTRFFNPDEVGLICTGSVRISGTKQTVMIRVYDNCSDAGTGEY
ncbi:hypothetical protein [Thiorhodovibrio frisius]|nr:hypothetical protein [Thiorhodovibrio frisius]